MKNQTDHLTLTFSALADPTRRSILAQLSQGQKTVLEIAKPFEKNMSLPAITKHLKVLEKAGLIKRGREAQWRPCQLNPEPIKEIDDWMQEFRQYWENSFDRLENYLMTIQKTERKKNGRKKKTKGK